RVNGNAWIDIPEFGSGNGIPSGHNGYNYITQADYVIPVPLGHLVTGNNTFEGTNAGQTGPYGFGWGQFGWYSIILRVYYDGSKTHSTGSISSPSSGGTFGENPVVTASVSGGTDRVDFLAYYDGYDTDGDGIWQEYHHDYAPLLGQTEPVIKNHVGTATGGSWQVTWNTQYVPDQAAGSIKMLARIRNSNGVWYVSPEVTGLTLQRSGSYVRLYKPTDMPERAWARGDVGVINIHVNIPGGDNVANASSAVGFVRTWNGADIAREPSDYNYRRFNGWDDGAYGGNHFYSLDIRTYPTSTLLSGTNTFTFYSSNILHHGIEILWPGPGLIVRYGGSSSNVPPSITTHPTNQSTSVGGTATFNVGATGTPPLSYKWQKNGVDIDGAINTSYTTPPVTAGDNGATFRCVVTNAYGNATSNSATLTVGTSPVGPTITTHPADQTVEVGQTATFSVGASGTAPLSYQWQKNGVDIGGAINATYTTPATVKADSGALFRCVVSNSVSDATSNTAMLRVTSPSAPVITFGPIDQLVGVGQPATFTVGAVGAGTLSYRWEKNGQTVSGAAGPSYTTPATVPGDSGTQYRCIVSNTIDSATSSNALLKVTTGSVSILTNSGFELGTSSWWFHTNGSGSDTVVPAGPNNPHAMRISIVTEGSNVQLYQTNVTLEAGATYLLYLRAYSSSGHNLSATVQKHTSPYTNYGLSERLFDLDTSWKSFTAQFTAAGFSGVATDGRLMLWLAPYDSTGDVFYIDDVVLAKLSSYAPPSVALQPADTSVKEGTTATFRIAAAGTPPFLYQWQKNSVNITDAAGPEYTMPLATIGDNGASFRCILENPVGDTTSSAATLTVTPVVVLAAPSLVSPPNRANLPEQPTAVSFVWNSGAGATKYWFELYSDTLLVTLMVVDSSLTDTTISVASLISEGSYGWRVRAGNAEGWGPYSGGWNFHKLGPLAVEPDGKPTAFALDQNYPNPFNPSTVIRYAVPSRSHVLLTIHNTIGELVTTLVQGERETGYYEVRFDGKGLSSGVYFYRMQAGSFVQTKKLLLLQ
ncbi:MAG: immunoglobulin domain-containing protein, partial [Bacteroidetes bacterium]|nr:immunoglobulin domain-containing protein [Bacteroidota bacterium]